MSTLSSVTAVLAGPSVALAQARSIVTPDPAKSPPPYAPQSAPTAIAAAIAPPPVTPGGNLGQSGNGRDPGYSPDGSASDGLSARATLLDIRI